MAVAVDEALQRLRWDTPFLAPLLQIVTKSGGEPVPLHPKPEQLRFDAMLAAQREAGLPMRIVALKARQVGISTWTQGKLIQPVTQTAHHHALVLAQNNDTAGQLFGMGKRMWENLPDDPLIKPRKVGGRKARLLELANGSWYRADNAREYEAGRGLTLHSVHCSEVASFPDAEQKLTGLLEAVPDEPGTLVVFESTPKGQNYFKEIWEGAESGQSGYAAFFSPWYREPDYTLPLISDAEADEFEATLGDGSIGEDEPDLARLMADEGYERRVILERLNWRRRKISGNFNGDVERFHQEYATTPEESFLTSGKYVFDISKVHRLRKRVRNLPEGKTGVLETFGPFRERESRGDIIRVPQAVKFHPSPINDDRSPGWRIYKQPVPKAQYVLGVDASGGDDLEGGTDQAYHAIEVIDHRTREQVAEYRSRIDADMLAMEVLKACLYYNRPWAAIEITGSWGLPAAKKLCIDFAYPLVYRRQRPASAKQKTLDLLGWQTTFETKQMLIAELREMLREETILVNSVGLASEFGTYIRDDRNKAKAEWGKTADRLIAFGIAVCVAHEKPLRGDRDERRSTSTIDHLKMDRIGGYTRA